jgi:phosphatidylserine/phosphatidylglycerophosphate/cardiolipin synthase-like enzyme
MRWRLALLVTYGLVAGSAGFGLSQKYEAAYSTAPQITTCFTPGENCTQFIVDAIDSAESEVLVQAFDFTSAEIIAALIRAKERGRTVRLLLDKKNELPRFPGAAEAHARGIPVLIDSKVKIAHNKVIIIDRKRVIEGSFNFSKAAQKSNAEDTNLIRNDPKVARRYVDNWLRRAAVSREFKPKPPEEEKEEEADD